MGDAKKRNVGDRKRAESPTEGHNALLFCVARSGFAAIPTYLPAIGLCKGGTWGGSLHTPTTDHSTQLITALLQFATMMMYLNLGRLFFQK